MICVAGVDGTPGGWAAVVATGSRFSVRRVDRLSDLLNGDIRFDAVAVDVPIGLLDHYELGGRECDRAAREHLGAKRGSSVFPAPVRAALVAKDWEEACAFSRASSPNGKALSKQTFAILPKIIEIDELLRMKPELLHVVHEVHPELCFSIMAGKPMAHGKRSGPGKAERRGVLKAEFADDFSTIEVGGREQRLPIVDIIDATVACWSASRIARGEARPLPDHDSRDAFGLPMCIWA
jgi:predicted RNase H-like nuclease